MKHEGHLRRRHRRIRIRGSVSALRLVEKGYRVAVLEAGRRFDDSDFPRPPGARIASCGHRHWLDRDAAHPMLNNVMVLAGAGVGGGSLVYANTLYVPPEPFFRDKHWGDITDWRRFAPLLRPGDAHARRGSEPHNDAVGPRDEAGR